MISSPILTELLRIFGTIHPRVCANRVAVVRVGKPSCAQQSYPVVTIIIPAALPPVTDGARKLLRMRGEIISQSLSVPGTPAPVPCPSFFSICGVVNLLLCVNCGFMPQVIKFVLFPVAGLAMRGKFGFDMRILVKFPDGFAPPTFGASFGFCVKRFSAHKGSKSASSSPMLSGSLPTANCGHRHGSKTGSESDVSIIFQKRAYFSGQPPCFLMLASISPIKRRVSSNAQMMR